MLPKVMIISLWLGGWVILNPQRILAKLILSIVVCLKNPINNCAPYYLKAYSPELVSLHYYMATETTSGSSSSLYSHIGKLSAELYDSMVIDLSLDSYLFVNSL